MHVVRSDMSNTVYFADIITITVPHVPLLDLILAWLILASK